MHLSRKAVQRTVGYLKKEAVGHPCFLVEVCEEICVVTSLSFVAKAEDAAKASATFWVRSPEGWGSSDLETHQVALSPDTLFVTDVELNIVVIACRKEDVIKLPTVGCKPVPFPQAACLPISPKHGAYVLYHFPKNCQRPPDELTIFLSLAQTTSGFKAVLEDSFDGPPPELNDDVIGGFLFFVEKEQSSLASNMPKEKGTPKELLGFVGVLHTRSKHELVLIGAKEIVWAAECLTSLQLLTKPELNEERKSRCFSHLRHCIADDSHKALKVVVMNGGLKTIVFTMGTYEKSVAMQEQGCLLLRNFAVDVPVGHPSLLSEGAVQTVSKAMAQHASHARVQEQGCGFFGNLACSGSGKQAVLIAGGLELVVEAMLVHFRDAAVQVQAIGALWNLGVETTSTQLDEAKGRGVIALCRAMGKHARDRVLQQIACAALSNLAIQSTLVKDSAADMGAPALICKAMTSFGEDAEVQKQACAALWSLSTNSIKNQGLFEAAEAVTAVVMVMQRHAKNLEVLERACGGLRSLIAHSETLKASCASSGAIKAVLEAMRRFEDQAGLQRQACGLLWNVSASNDAFVWQAISKGSCMTCLERAASQHQDNASMIESVCGTVRNLVAGDPDTSIPLVLEGSLLEVIFSGLLVHINEVLIQRQGIELILLLVQHRPSVCDRLVAKGCIKAIVAAMRTYVRDVVVQERGCYAWRWLCDDRTGTRPDAKLAGAAALIAEAMRHHISSFGVQLRGCGALAHLAGANVSMSAECDNGGDDEADDAIKLNSKGYPQDVAAVDGISLICSAMRKQLNSPALASDACLALRLVYAGSPSHRPELEALVAIIDIVAEAMQRHPNSIEVTAEACDCLVVFFQNQSHGLNSCDVCSVVLKALKRHCDNKRVQQSALVCLRWSLGSDTPRDVMMAAANVAVCALKEDSIEAELARTACEILYNCIDIEPTLFQGEVTIDVGVGVRHAMSAFLEKLDLQLVAFNVVQSLIIASTAVETGRRKGAQRHVPASQRDLNANHNESFARSFGVIVPDVFVMHYESLALQRSVCQLLYHLFVWEPWGFFEFRETKSSCVDAETSFDGSTEGRRKSSQQAQDSQGSPSISPRTRDFQGSPRGLSKESHGLPSGSPRSQGSRRGSPRMPTSRSQHAEEAIEVVEPDEPAGPSLCKRIALTLCDIMAGRESDVELQRSACRAFWALCHENPGAKEQAVAEGAVTKVSFVLGQWTHRVGTMCDALAAIWGIVANSAAARDAAASEKVPVAVCKAMEANVDNKTLQQYGCQALASLASGHLENMKLAMSAGASDIIRKCMERHEGVPAVQLGAANAIVALVGKEHRHRTVLGQTTICLLCHAMERHLKSCDVQRAAMRALLNLMIEDSFNKGMALDCDCTKLVFASMERFADDATLQRHAMELIQCIAFDNPAVQRDIIQADGIATITNTMRKHDEDPGVHKNGALALGNLAFQNPEAKKQMSRAGALTLLSSDLAAFADNAEVCDAVVWTLKHSITGSSHNREALKKLDVAEKLARILRIHNTHANVQQIGSSCLSSLENDIEDLDGLSDHHDETGSEDPPTPPTKLGMSRLGSFTSSIGSLSPSVSFCRCCRRRTSKQRF